MKTPIGFATGTIKDILPRVSEENLDFFAGIGATAVEFSLWEDKEIDSLEKITPEMLKSFKFISAHTDAFEKADEISINRLKKIERAHERLHFNNIVIHPSGSDLNFLYKYDLPISMENMDNRKEDYKFVEDLKDLFSKYPNFKMTLDLNHCKTNDSNMKLADELTKNFSDRIVEIHLSAYKIFHDPLHKFNQMEILSRIPKNVPIIIESMCKTLNDAKNELSYINNFLGKTK